MARGSIRSFLAIPIPERIQNRLRSIENDLQESRADVRWVEPEKVHLTIKFFGNIEEKAVDGIAEALREVVRGATPFSVRIQGIGAFPDLRNPRVVWLGLTEGAGLLISLRNAVEEALEKAGFKADDRPFKAHLTLGRVRSGNKREELIKRMEKYRDTDVGEFSVEGLILFKSDLKPSGPIYTPLRSIVFCGGKS